MGRANGLEAAAAMAIPGTPAAQANGRQRRIGVLIGTTSSDPQAQANLAAFAKGLDELGWKDQVQLEIRWAAGQPTKARAAAKAPGSVGESQRHQPPCVAIGRKLRAVSSGGNRSQV